MDNEKVGEEMTKEVSEFMDELQKSTNGGGGSLGGLRDYLGGADASRAYPFAYSAPLPGGNMFSPELIRELTTRGIPKNMDDLKRIHGIIKQAKATAHVSRVTHNLMIQQNKAEEFARSMFAGALTLSAAEIVDKSFALAQAFMRRVGFPVMTLADLEDAEKAAGIKSQRESKL